MSPSREQFRRILVATDFSDCARDAIARAALLPLAQGAALTLVHIIASSVPERWREHVESSVRRSLDEAASFASSELRAAGRPDVEVTSAVGTGLPFVELVRRSRASGADLVVVGRHGRRPFRDLFIGSTAIRVVRTGEVPVLVVGRKPAAVYRDPLLATDREDASLRLVELVKKATAPGTRVALVSACDLPFRDFTSPEGPEGSADARRSYHDEAARQLDKFIGCTRDSGIEWVPLLRWGDASVVITEIAKERNADLIVIGTQRTRLAYTLLGSVAEYVLERAPCDVLVARLARISFELP